MVLDRTLISPGHKDQICNAGRNSFFDRVLDQGLVYDW
jgi:hypothetical protein